MPENLNLPKHPFDWSTLHSHYALRDEWLTVRVDTCQMPAGQVVEPYYVFEYRDYVNVVAITPRREVVLIRQYRHGIGRTILEIPGGVMDPGDNSPQLTALRELREETGYSAARLEHLCTLSPNPSSYNNLVHSYLALDAQIDAAAMPDEHEQLEIVLVPLEELREMLRAGQFLQAMHASALFYALLHLKEIGI